MSSTLSNITAGIEAAGGANRPTMEPTSWLQDLNIAVEVICPVFAFLFVLLRIFVRAQMGTFGWDDRCIIMAMLLSIGMAVGSIFVIKEAFVGIHFYDIPPNANLSSGLIWIFFVGAIYNPVLAFVKQSVLVFILRIAGLNQRVRMVCYLTSVFNMAEMVSALVVVIFQCKPVESFWHVELGQECINQEAFAISTTLLTILTDIVVVALPFYVFLGLQMSRKKKIALILVFSMGLIVTIVSILRLYSLCLQFTADDPDVNFSIGPSIAAIECNLAIVTACAPTLWPLVRRWKQLGSQPKSDYCPHCRCGQQHISHMKGLSSHTSGWTGSSTIRKPLTRDESFVTKTFGTDTSITAMTTRAVSPTETTSPGTMTTLAGPHWHLREMRGAESIMGFGRDSMFSQDRVCSPELAGDVDCHVMVVGIEVDRPHCLGAEKDLSVEAVREIEEEPGCDEEERGES